MRSYNTEISINQSNTKPNGLTEFNHKKYCGIIIDTSYYHSRYADLENNFTENDHYGLLMHWITHGVNEGRLGSFDFDSIYVRFRMEKLLDKSLNIDESIILYFELPEDERFVPVTWFSTFIFREVYKSRFPEISKFSDYALYKFYLEKAWDFLLSPNGLFNAETFVFRNRDLVRETDRHPFYQFANDSKLHGTIYGYASEIPERNFVLRNCSSIEMVTDWFDEEFYQSIYKDVHNLVRRGTISCGLEHYLAIGYHQSRIPSAHLADPVILSSSDKNLLANKGVYNFIEENHIPKTKISLHKAKIILDYLSGSKSVNEGTIVAEIWKHVESPPVSLTFDASSYKLANEDLCDLDTTELFDHWIKNGIMEGRLSPNTLYNKIDFRKISEIRFGVNLIAPISLQNGLGTSSRGYYQSLLEMNVPTKVIDVSGLIHSGEKIDIVDPDCLPFDVNLIILNPDRVDALIYRYSTRIFDKKINIGLFVWELLVPRPEWDRSYRLFDHIITPSKFCADIFSFHSGLDVTVIPHALHNIHRSGESAAHNKSEEKQWLRNIHNARSSGKKIVGFIADASSGLKRKGLDVLLKAIENDVSTENPFHFVIKTHSFDTRDSDGLPYIGNKSVQFINQMFSADEVTELRSELDVYVSPHRAEGFGLNIFESLSIGIPTVLSRYSGALELLGDDYPYYIEGTYSEIEEDSGPYRKGSVWFEPDPESLIKKLHDAISDRSLHSNIFNKYKDKIGYSLSTREIGEKLKQLISRLVSEKNTSKALRRSISVPSEVLSKSTKTFSIPEILTRPQIAVITPTYNTKPEWLNELYVDLCGQTDQRWEWCITDDGSTNKDTILTLDHLQQIDSRIKIKRNKVNRGISCATNDAVLLSTAPYIMMVDHDDRLSSLIISEYVKTIKENNLVDLLYCDEAKIYPDGSIRDYYYKPDYSPEHLSSAMYLLHCLCVRKSLFLRLGGYRADFDGSQDHDFALRVASEKGYVKHISKVLYYWRVVSTSTANDASAKPLAAERGRVAVEEYMDRLGVPADVEHGQFPGIYRVRPHLNNPLVDLVVLSGAKESIINGQEVTYVQNFVESILNTTSYLNYKINVFFDCGQEDIAEKIMKLDSRVVSYTSKKDECFNFARKANQSIRETSSEFVVLLNDDMACVNADWLHAIIEPLFIPGVGLVGGKLLYENMTVQHAGIVLGLEGPAGHIFRGLHDNDVGYQGFTHMMRNYSAVTGALHSFKRETFDLVGGYDEYFSMDFNDVDFCLKIIRSGLRVVYTPYAKLFHYESKSAVRFRQDELDRKVFLGRWSNLIHCDPYYNLSLSSATNQPEEMNFYADDERLSCTGNRVSGRIESKGTSDTLIYGPYIPLSPGRYKIQIHGKLSSIGEYIYADLCYDKGASVVISIPINEINANGIIVEFLSEINRFITDAEVRLHVSNTTDCYVTSVSINKIGSFLT